MKRRRQEQVTIRIEVRRGKEVLFGTIVPEDAGLAYEFPKPIELGAGFHLDRIDVVPYVSKEVVAELPLNNKTKTAKDAVGEMVGKLTEFMREQRTGEHKHAVASSTVRAFLGCVSEECDERSHGNVTYHDTCRCGAKRKRNANRQHEEVGEWDR